MTHAIDCDLDDDCSCRAVVNTDPAPTDRLLTPVDDASTGHGLGAPRERMTP